MSEFIKYEDIKAIEIDPTSRCNLLCPQCARVEHGKLNSKLPLSELTKEDYIHILSSDFLNHLNIIIFNGNYGDCMISSHFIFALEYIFSHSHPFLIAFTNGSLRSEKWWENLAYLLKNKHHTIVFSIDGLKDTNHKYRINSNFEKIIANATAFIKAGGTARWDFLVFKHNEHQVEEAKALAKKIGFSKFNLKQTFRFNSDYSYYTNKNKTYTKVFNKKSKIIDQIEPSKNNESASSFQKTINRYGTWKNYIDKTPIACKFQKNRSLFIDFMAQLWPCPWLAAPIYFFDKNNIQKKQIESLLQKYGKDFNNLRSTV